MSDAQSLSHVDSYYAASASDDATHPPLRGRTTADVCIVGGGYTGLSAAIELQRRGFDTVLLEANRIGWGASGRNGGQIVTGFSCGMDRIRAALGEDGARRAWDMTEEAKRLLRERVERYRIECDLRDGYIFAAPRERHLEELAAERREWADLYGYEGLELLDRGAMRRAVDSAAYCGGLRDPGGGHLHPLNYALGLARAARAEGARLHEGSRVHRFDGRNPIVVETDGGAVAARHLLLCGNAYLGDLVPELRRRIMPVGTYIAATEPLAEPVASTLIPGGEAVADTNFVLDYYRMAADRRLLFGGRVSYTTREPRDLRAAMRRRMTAVFPQLEAARISHVWGGYVAITRERSPHFGRLRDDIYFAQGFSGQGVALTGLAGLLMAEALAGAATRFDLFARLPHRSFPGGPALRTPLLALAMLYYRLRDLV